MKHNEMNTKLLFLENNIKELESFVKFLSDTDTLVLPITEIIDCEDNTLAEFLETGAEIISSYGCRVADITDELKLILGGFNNGRRQET